MVPDNFTKLIEHGIVLDLNETLAVVGSPAQGGGNWAGTTIQQHHHCENRRYVQKAESSLVACWTFLFRAWLANSQRSLDLVRLDLQDY